MPAGGSCSTASAPTVILVSIRWASASRCLALNKKYNKKYLKKKYRKVSCREQYGKVRVEKQYEHHGTWHHDTQASLSSFS